MFAESVCPKERWKYRGNETKQRPRLWAVSSLCVWGPARDHGEGAGSAGGSEEWGSAAGSQASLQSQVQQNQ